MKQSLKMAGVATLGAGIGAVIGYKLAESRLAARFDERLKNETDGMKEFFTNVKQKYDSPEEAAAALLKDNNEVVEDPRQKAQKIRYDKIVKGEGYVDNGDGLEEFVEVSKVEEVVHKNVFETVRNPDAPYVISQEEFMANDTSYEQASLTFYTKGSQLADVRDEIIENVDDVLGKDFFLHFGAGSSDEHIVHVRNEKLRMEFEVCRSDRSYEQDVLGQEEPDPLARRQG